MPLASWTVIQLYNTSIQHCRIHVNSTPIDCACDKNEENKVKLLAGVNICPKKSETVYPEIWGILKLSVLVNQKIFKTAYQSVKSTFFGQC